MRPQNIRDICGELGSIDTRPAAQLLYGSLVKLSDLGADWRRIAFEEGSQSDVLLAAVSRMGEEQKREVDTFFAA